MTSAMFTAVRTLLQPLNLAMFATWLAVGLAQWPEVAALPTPGVVWTLMLLFLLGFLVEQLVPQRRRGIKALIHAALASIALAVIWLAPFNGTSPVLLVILIVRLASTWPAWATFGAALAMNVALYIALRVGGHSAPGIVTLLFVGFEAFAALTARYARSAEETRDRLARVNADLLATRALLADSARDAERIRVARELHDIAGHKLTAMTLNLRVLAMDPAIAERSQVRIAQQLAGELLDDIRDVVHALRDVRGLDLETALRALAAPLPRPTLRLEIDEEVQVTDPAIIEAILRLVQEALTNSARHTDADVVHVHVAREGQSLRICIEDDGRLRGAVREGHGIAGMRERIGALHGEFSLGTSSRGALRIDVRLPAVPAAAT